MRSLLILIITLGFLAGCGKKGDLYMPDPTPAPISTPAQTK